MCVSNHGAEIYDVMRRGKKNARLERKCRKNEKKRIPEKWKWLYYAREPFLFYHFFLYILHPILSCIHEQLVNKIEMRYSIESHICMIRVCLCFRLCCLIVIQYFSLRSYDCVEACRHFTMGECGVIIITCTSFFCPSFLCELLFGYTHTHILSLSLSDSLTCTLQFASSSTSSSSSIKNTQRKERSRGNTEKSVH